MFSSTVWRCSGRECWNTMLTPARAMRCAGHAGDIGPVEPDGAGIGAREPHDQRHHRRLAGAVRADQPDDFAGAQIETHVLDGDHAAETFAELAHLQADRAGHSRSLRVQRVAEQPFGEEQDHGQRDGGHHERVELTERPQELGGEDQEHGAERGAEDSAPPAQHRSDDDLNAIARSTTVLTDAVPM